MQKSWQFQRLEAAWLKTSECQGQSIDFFLIEPVQRLPRYELLLKELAKAVADEIVTSPSNAALQAEAAQLLRAQQCISAVLLSGERASIMDEKTLKVLQIQDELRIDLVAPARYCLCCLVA